MSPLQYLHGMPPMNLSSLSFIYVLLPVCLFLFYLAPKSLRPAVLLASSLGFYAFSQPEYLWLPTACVLADFVLLRGMYAAAGKPRLRGVLFGICLLKNIGLIVYFGALMQIKLLYPPLGLTVACVSGIYAALSAYRSREAYLCGIIPFSVYALFFPRLYAGPLVPYEEFAGQLGGLEYRPAGILTGFGCFIEGVFKYAVIGRGLFALYASIRLISADDASLLSAWTLLLSFSLSLYFTFSGLCDAARGIAGMFGFVLPQNFYYPYQSRSVTDFTERFNMTVMRFLKRVVYVPLQSGRKDALSDVLSTLAAGMLAGIWFGMRVNYLVWGAVLALFVLAEKYLYPGLLKRLPTLFCRGYALCAVLLGFTIFAGDSLSQSLGYIARMFDFTVFYNDRILYLLSSNWLLLAAGCFFATNITNLLTAAMRKASPKISLAVFGAADFLILVFFTALSLGGGRL